MSKILKLREWLTVEEAARRLTISSQEEVSEADLLRLALDGHLTLSVHFVNHAKARPVTIEPLDGELSSASIREESEDFFRAHPQLEKSDVQLTDLQNFIRRFRGDLLPDGKRVLIYEGDGQRPVTLEGVWDLLMLGAESLDVEHAYQYLTGGVPVELVCLGGPLVASPDRSQCFQLLDSYKREARPSASTKPGGNALSRESVEAMGRMDEILGSLPGLSPPEKRTLEWDYETVWHPAAGLPKDHTLVVRSAELRNLERKLLEPDVEMDGGAGAEKPLHPSERRSVAQIIATLAAEAGLDLSAPYAADETLRAMAATLGVELPSSPETVVKFLKLAAPYLAKQ
ncbi:hypothetical protein IMF22_20175 [Pseudomonas poae]|uniref:Uncharacterized protein n=1 Tax=Pseudomonas poae TaxID=200451 RepID=A0A7M1KDA8_9PSED|nr:hypothetical protein [Pseudomonas poae]QOQ73808.1 hypothetical protein IMF22_20175 [Pseudomonas poae]